MNHRARHLIPTGLLWVGLTAAAAVPAPGPLPMLGAATLSAQTVRQEEVARFLEARRAINAEEFERAVPLFQAIRNESPLTTPMFEADSYYWEAFARYRLGDLGEARLLLETLMAAFPEGQFRNNRGQVGRLYHDARALGFEIRNQQASSGDAGAAEQLLREAEATLEVPAVASGFRTMSVDVEGNVFSLPVSLADVEGPPDSVLAAVDQARAAAMASEADAEADARTAEVHAQVDSLAAALRGQQQPTPSTGETLAEIVQRTSRAAGDYEQLVEEYQRQAAEYDRQAAEYDWQRAEYQEAARSSAQAQEACDDVSVQLAALGAVMRYDQVNRLHVLRDVLAREDACSRRLHEEAVGLVGRQATDEAEDVLLNIIMSTTERSVRRAALQELWRFDSSDSFERLRSILQSSDDSALQTDAIDGLRRSRFGAGTAIQNALARAAIEQGNSDRVRNRALYALGQRDDVGAGVFIPIYEGIESDDLKEYLFSRVAIKVRANEDMETAAWARSVAFGQEESADVRGEAFTAWASHPTVTVAYLQDLYGDISEAFLKRQAIYSIYQRADSDASVPAVLMELIRNEPDEEVRERGIYWLGRTESDEAVDFLLELLSPPASDTVVPDTVVRRRPG